MAGTPIATPTGMVAIERLHAGDAVLAYDLTLDRIATSIVTATFEHANALAGELTLDDGTIVGVTPNHPIYVPASRDYLRADALDDGSSVLLWDGSALGTAGVASFALAPDLARSRVYNVEIASYHNYFAAGLLVHNKEPCDRDCQCWIENSGLRSRGLPADDSPQCAGAAATGGRSGGAPPPVFSSFPTCWLDLACANGVRCLELPASSCDAASCTPFCSQDNQCGTLAYSLGVPLNALDEGRCTESAICALPALPPLPARGTCAEDFFSDAGSDTEDAGR